MSTFIASVASTIRHQDKGMSPRQSQRAVAAKTPAQHASGVKNFLAAMLRSLSVAAA